MIGHVDERPSLFMIICNFLAVLLIWRTNYCTSMYYVNSYFPASLFMLVYALWLFFAYVMDRLFMLKLLAHAWPLTIFMIININVSFLFLGNLDQLIINYIIAFMMFSIAVFYVNHGNKVFKVFTIIFILFDTAVKAIYSIQQIAINPNIIRQMSTADVTANDKISVMIADYSSVYACMLLVVFIFSVIRYINTKSLKVISTVFMLILGYFILDASFFFALILFAFGLLGSIFIKKKRYYFIVPLLILLTIYLLRFPLSVLCYNMSEQSIWSETIRGKWGDIANLLRYGQEGAYMSNMRLNAMYHSIETFWRHPIIGIFGWNDDGLMTGGHAGWLDGFAEFGFVRYFLFVTFIYKAFKYLASRVKEKSPIYITATLYIIMGFLNPIIFPQIWVVLFIIIPFYYDGTTSRIKQQQ